jgi:hypothetical protein
MVRICAERRQRPVAIDTGSVISAPQSGQGARGQSRRSPQDAIVMWSMTFRTPGVVHAELPAKSRAARVCTDPVKVTSEPRTATSILVVSTVPRFSAVSIWDFKTLGETADLIVRRLTTPCTPGSLRTAQIVSLRWCSHATSPDNVTIPRFAFRRTGHDGASVIRPSASRIRRTISASAVLGEARTSTSILMTTALTP